MVKLKTKESGLLLEEVELAPEEPQVWVQPPNPIFPTWDTKLKRLFRQARESYHSGNKITFSECYNPFLSKFGSVLNWALDSWDYLVTVQGCRFLERLPYEQIFHRGRYRAFTKNDYQKMIHKIFKENLLKYSGKNNFSVYLSDNFWKCILDAYEKLKEPLDSRQRLLTSYSYLRCIPYKFLNSCHQEMVETVLDHLPGREREIIDLYFLSFYTNRATAEEMDASFKEVMAGKKDGLKRIYSLDPLTHALLGQIERY